MNVQFDRDVPIPPNNKRTKRWLWVARMEPGDSRFVPGVARLELKTGADAYARKLGFRFVCRAVDGGARIWRVE